MGRKILIVSLFFALTGCLDQTSTGFHSHQGTSSPDSTSNNNNNTGGTKSVSVSWSASHERLVNTTGGGYKVYYSTSSTITGSTPYVTVAYSSLTGTPTTTTITGLQSGTYYINVVAYSSQNATGSVATQTTVVVP